MLAGGATRHEAQGAPRRVEAGVGRGMLEGESMLVRHLVFSARPGKLAPRKGALKGARRRVIGLGQRDSLARLGCAVGQGTC